MIIGGIEMLYVLVSSVYKKECGFREYRYILKDAIMDYTIFTPVLAPETIPNMKSFLEKIVDPNSFALVVLAGKKKSDAVLEEFRTAASVGLPIIFLVEEGSEEVFENMTAKIAHLVPAKTFYYSKIVFSNPDELKAEFKKAFEELLLQTLKGVYIKEHPHGTYHEAELFLKNTFQSFILNQFTSTLLLGPNITNNKEISFYNELNKWLLSLKEYENVIFYHLFHYNMTLNVFKESLKDNSPTYNVRMSYGKFRKIFEEAQKYPEKIVIRFTNEYFTPVAIADRSMGIPFGVGPRKYFLIMPHLNVSLQSAERIKNEILRTGEPLTQETLSAFDRLIEEYG